MKKFLNINAPYAFEWNDLRALVTILNVVLIMIFGLSISWFGLAVALFGIVKDLTDKNRRLNGILMHCASAVLNIYFLMLLYRG